MNLSDLAPQARIAGFLLGLALWAAPAVGVWLYMAGQQAIAVEAAKAESRTEALAEVTTKVDAAVAEARKEWARTQAATNRDAEEARQRTERALSAQRERADTLYRQLLAHIHAQPLPDSCRLDPERVRLYSGARRDGAAPAD